ncbi:OmpH family outer membrane protein [Chryseobacterium arthrosphaerae]|uniref:Molecular chaperone Skp n=1 Tax=Chryseobacterium arthrosphaerae TaxID=651561 RepID=A0A1B8ZBD2_9FLAO|nr:OmpH family outer membrane protein [Chryseobacterium arthrosphaerae]AYZ14055.1 OmpH family outer membrane protein [Chryseobacterium arthrosphaerae]MDG4654721.1 OmpH family outer membrane protein [Chryseobacterium arthrosphaerae]OCA68875.1 molecular chaperone Skp [Chryseobacterium arthrosphaerae]QUY54874.1 OmpH family outer membrane protein [Chryseobacterium arthrosphaerae]UEQ74768.1 OmpH family outer membrane protein [Chryseobacterium arthrosphaerae]
MKKLSVLFAAVMMVVSVGMAKAQKIATLDVLGVLNAMPEKKKADADLKTFLDTKQAEIKKKADAGQAKLKQYTEEAPKKTADENKAREAELQKIQEEIAQMQEKAQKDLQAKQEVVFGPIEKKLNDAVEKVSKANGYEYVMDANSPAFLYKAGTDATAAVKKELGIQ